MNDQELINSTLQMKVVRIGLRAPFEYVATARMPSIDKFGRKECSVRTYSKDNAVLECFKAAEADFGYHGSAIVDFVDCY